MSRVWWSRALCPWMLVDILGTNCDQCQSTVQYCFTSMETVRLVRMESPGRPPRFSHSSWTLTSEFQDKHTVEWFPRQGNRFQTKKPNLHQIWFSDDRALIIAKIFLFEHCKFSCQGQQSLLFKNPMQSIYMQTQKQTKLRLHPTQAIFAIELSYLIDFFLDPNVYCPDPDWMNLIWINMLWKALIAFLTLWPLWYALL